MIVGLPSEDRGKPRSSNVKVHASESPVGLVCRVSAPNVKVALFENRVTNRVKKQGLTGKGLPILSYITTPSSTTKASRL